MNKQGVYVVADAIISPMGKGTSSNFDQITGGNTGVRAHSFHFSHQNSEFFCSKFEDRFWEENQFNGLSKSELLAFLAGREALSKSGSGEDENILLVYSTTKGNIGELHLPSSQDLQYHQTSIYDSAVRIATALGVNPHPVIVSNACISGIVAIQTAHRLLKAGMFRQALIVGVDVISDFIVSGFNSFKALSGSVCKPFDESRSGLNLGEGAGAILVSTNQPELPAIEIYPAYTTNDANHISGPSRTGLELSMAIDRAVSAAGLSPSDIDVINAHGTATVYNDEMESKAIYQSGLGQAPVHSLKPFFGHTLGAAGIIESAIAFESMRRQLLLPTPGFETLGVSVPITISDRTEQKKITHVLKTASGFGGCNAAIIYKYLS